MEYTHFSPDEDPGYRFMEEVLEFNNRKILFLLTELHDEFVIGCGQCVVSPSQTRTVIVKGYIKNWRYKNSEEGRAISELEPVNQEERKDITELIESRYKIPNIHFG